jgi:hypothetical protein
VVVSLLRAVSFVVVAVGGCAGVLESMICTANYYYDSLHTLLDGLCGDLPGRPKPSDGMALPRAAIATFFKAIRWLAAGESVANL